MRWQRSIPNNSPMPEMASLPETASTPPPVANRLKAVLIHVPYFTIEGTARLALDCDVAASTISRLIRGKLSPSYSLVKSVTQALSERLGRSLDMRDLFTTDGTYPTVSTCELVGCKGCLPPWAWNELTDTLKPEWRHQQPGEWSKTKPGEWSRVEADLSSPGAHHLTDIS